MNSSLRIGGLASGIDTDKIIKDLMKAENAKMDVLNQNKKLNEWRTELYNEYNKKLASFVLEARKEFGLDSYSSTGKLSSSSVGNFNWVKKATSSNKDYAKVSATAGAVNGSFDVHVTRLAKNISISSSAKLDNEFAPLKNQFNLSDTDIIEFTIENGKGVSHTFKYSGSDLTDKTIADIANDINNYRDGNKKGLGVKAVYDASINRFFFQTEKTGEQENFKITQGVNSTVNFIAGTNNKLKLAIDYGTVYKGADGEINFNGANNIKITDNNVKIYGIDMELKAEGVDFKVNVSTDVDSVYEKIKGFVDKYNKLVDEFSLKLGEKKYKDFKPLTTEQRKGMSDEEAKMWTTKAKSGLLRDDGMFTSTLSNIRSGLYEKIEGTSHGINFLFDIGITTDKYSQGQTGGKLKIDESRLKEAIKDNVDGVLEVLFKQPDPLEKDEKVIRKTSGIFTRIQADITDGIKKVIDKAGTGGNNDYFRKVQINILVDFVTKKGSISDLDSDKRKIEKDIYNMKRYLKSKEDGYWSKFTAMEKALKKMQSQSNWLTQQMGG
ncbi:flagellar filament capping protein FliD [Clostridiaceae bacterium M8S5]|nr:flagellar filament capping protein FliD [Clostridiaceae bacterium M8S5]